MSSTVQLATIRTIPIRLHATLLVVFGLLVFQLGALGLPAGLLLFASVLLHELGHSVVAQRFGIRIAGIDLHLLGGVALMKDEPKTPKQELLIAAAGPAVSFALGLSFLGLSVLFAIPFDFAAPTLATLVPYAAAINLGMAIFNLIPALPMDGGRILRALLSLKMSPLRATTAAARVARFFAALFVFFGFLWGSWTLPLIGFMVWFMSRREERAAALRAASGHFDVPGLGAFRMRGPAGANEAVIDVVPRPRVVVVSEEFFGPTWRR